MTADVDIANLALTYCETAPIASFNDQSNAARVMNAGYTILRDKLQRTYRWSFTKVYAQLPQLTTPPPFEYEYAYQLPAGLISLELASQQAPGTGSSNPGQPSSPANSITMPGVNFSDYQGGRMQDYRVVGQQIYAHLPPPLCVIYSALTADANQFDKAFIEAFACYLAWKLGPRINSSLAKKKDLKEDFTISLREAVSANAVELPPVQVPDDTFILSRIIS